MSLDARARTRTLDPGQAAREQARAGLPVAACPFCGGEPRTYPNRTGGFTDFRVCCCRPCYVEKNGETAAGVACDECPHQEAP